jgi:hypothetical protein
LYPAENLSERERFLIHISIDTSRVLFLRSATTGKFASGREACSAEPEFTMSRRFTRSFAALSPLIGCGLFAQAAPGDGTVMFSPGYPAPGGEAKEVSVAVGWSDCVNAKYVEVVIYKAVSGVQTEVKRVKTTVTKSTGTWATTITDCPSGTVITSADVTVSNADGVPKGILAAKNLAPISVTVP